MFSLRAPVAPCGPDEQPKPDEDAEQTDDSTENDDNRPTPIMAGGDTSRRHASDVWM